MQYLANVNRLSEILRAELEGRQFDCLEAISLTEQLSKQCPDIASTLNVISLRLTAETNEGAGPDQAS